MLSPRCWFPFPGAVKTDGLAAQWGENIGNATENMWAHASWWFPNHDDRAPRGRPGIHKGDRCLDSRYIRGAIRTQVVEVRVWPQAFLTLCPWTHYHIYKTEIIIAPALQGTLCMPHSWNNSVIITTATDSLSLKATGINAMNTNPCSQGGRGCCSLEVGWGGGESLGNVALGVKPGQSSRLGSEGICWCQSSLCWGAGMEKQILREQELASEDRSVLSGRGTWKKRRGRGRHRVGGRLAKSVRGGGCSADLTGSSWRSELTLCPNSPTSPPAPEMWVVQGLCWGRCYLCEPEPDRKLRERQWSGKHLLHSLVLQPTKLMRRRRWGPRPSHLPTPHPRASLIRMTGLQLRSQKPGLEVQLRGQWASGLGRTLHLSRPGHGHAHPPPEGGTALRQQLHLGRATRHC